MEPLWDFLTLKKESLDIIIKFLGLLLGGSSLISLFKWLNHRAWINQVRLDIKVFEIIDDVDSLLPKMYGSDKNNDPLADHNFAYQARDNECDIKSELRQMLTKQRYLLIWT